MEDKRHLVDLKSSSWEKLCILAEDNDVTPTAFMRLLISREWKMFVEFLGSIPVDAVEYREKVLDLNEAVDAVSDHYSSSDS